MEQSNSSDGESYELLHDEDPFPRSSDGDVATGLLSQGTERPLRTTTEESKSTAYLILLTIAIGGLQIVWSVEMSSISPFILSLGLSKSLLALVWIAGPLSGTLVQPYVGLRSDNYRGRWGRRRPFIVIGGLVTITSLLLLSWTREIVGGLAGFLGGSADSQVARIMSQVFAILLVYVLDFAINVIQAGIRALIVDCAPTHQQEEANAWANRLTGLGNIVGYVAGYANLPETLPFLGSTQFQVLCAIASFSIASTGAISCLAMQEEDPASLAKPSGSGKVGLVSFFKTLVHAARNLAPQVKAVCLVQIWAWIGWFPFLFYISTYVGSKYAEPYFADNPHMSREEIEAVWERGTKAGSFALFIYAMTSFIASIVLPLLIVPAYENPNKGRKPNLHWLSFDTLRIPGLTLRWMWMLSHVCFTLLMWSTFFVHSVTGATVLVGAIGVPWALTNWAPFALIAAEISKREAIQRDLRTRSIAQESYVGHADQQQDERNNMSHSTSDQAGVVLGIHNVAIAAPQVVATLVSSAIFKALQKPRGQPGDDSLSWVLRFGGLCALGAAWSTRFVKDGDEVDVG